MVGACHICCLLLFGSLSVCEMKTPSKPPVMVFKSAKSTSIDSLVESLLLATSEQSPMRSEMVRVLAGAGLKEAVDLIFSDR